MTHMNQNHKNKNKYELKIIVNIKFINWFKILIIMKTISKINNYSVRMVF